MAATMATTPVQENRFGVMNASSMITEARKQMLVDNLQLESQFECSLVLASLLTTFQSQRGLANYAHSMLYRRKHSARDWRCASIGYRMP